MMENNAITERRGTMFFRRNFPDLIEEYTSARAYFEFQNNEISRSEGRMEYKRHAENKEKRTLFTISRANTMQLTRLNITNH